MCYTDFKGNDQIMENTTTQSHNNKKQNNGGFRPNAWKIIHNNLAVHTPQWQGLTL